MTDKILKSTYIEPSESILEDLFEQQPLHTIVAAWTMC